jgi:hypothetical protein
MRHKQYFVIVQSTLVSCFKCSIIALHVRPISVTSALASFQGSRNSLASREKIQDLETTTLVYPTATSFLLSLSLPIGFGLKFHQGLFLYFPQSLSSSLQVVLYKGVPHPNTTGPRVYQRYIQQQRNYVRQAGKAPRVEEL